MCSRGPSYWPSGPYPPSQRRSAYYSDHTVRRPGSKSSALTPDEISWLDGKETLGPTSKDVSVLQSTTAPAKGPSLGLSVEEAFARAEQALSGHTRKQIVCITNASKPLNQTLKRKLPYKVFNELDKEFFLSVLRGNVSLGWSDLPDGILSQTSRPGYRGNPRIRIDLSPSLAQYGYGIDIFSALIHQMVHAYYLQCCGYRDRFLTGTGHDLEHEEPFYALLKCVGEHFKPLQRALAGHLFVPHGKIWSHYTPSPSAGVSCCYIHGSQFNDVDIQNWRNLAVGTTESKHQIQIPEHSGNPKEDTASPRNLYFVNKDGTEDPPKPLEDWKFPREAYIFLSFDERCYPVARSSVRDLAALTTSPYFKNKSWLQLPQGTREAAFLTFYMFLVYNDLPPFFKNTRVSSDESSSQGPPKIKSYEADAPAQVSALIVAFYLGRTLLYAPFCDFVLKKLNSLHVTAEDPISALEMIYGVQKPWDLTTTSRKTGSADRRLRYWAISWLAVKLPNDMGRHGACFKTNLNVLRFHPDCIKRYERLKTLSPEFKVDDEAAKARIGLFDSSLLHLGMPVSTLQPEASPNSQHSCSMQYPFDSPGSVSSLDRSLAGLQSDMAPFSHSKSEDKLDLYGLLEDLQPLYIQNPVETSRSPHLPFDPRSLQRSEIPRLVQERALRNGLATLRQNLPRDSFERLLSDLEQHLRGNQDPRS